jgi:hypothetical protein
VYNNVKNRKTYHFANFTLFGIFKQIFFFTLVFVKSPDSLLISERSIELLWQSLQVTAFQLQVLNFLSNNLLMKLVKLFRNFWIIHLEMTQ